MRTAVFLLGLLVGFAIGWLAFDTPHTLSLGATADEAPGGGGVSSASGPPSEPPSLPTLAPAPRTVPPSPEPSGPRADSLPAGLRRAIHEQTHDAAIGAALAAGDVERVVAGLIELARRLYAEGDRGAFLLTLDLLARTGAPTAQAYFVELIPLAAPDWPESFVAQGKRMLRYLAHAKAPGIGAAARRRVERESVKYASNLGPGWRGLLLLHGNAADRRRLIELDGNAYEVLRFEIAHGDEAKAERALDEGRRAYRAGRLGDEPSRLMRLLTQFAVSFPEAGRPQIIDALQSGDYEGAPLAAGWARPLALAHLHGRMDFERAARQYQEIADPATRYEAYAALFQVGVRRRDEPAFRRTVEEVVGFVERVADGAGPIRLEDQPALRAALDALNLMRWPPTKRAVEAFERVGKRIEGEGRAFWGAAAARQRENLDARWK